MDRVAFTETEISVGQGFRRFYEQCPLATCWVNTEGYILESNLEFKNQFLNLSRASFNGTLMGITSDIHSREKILKGLHQARCDQFVHLSFVLDASDDGIKREFELSLQPSPQAEFSSSHGPLFLVQIFPRPSQRVVAENPSSRPFNLRSTQIIGSKEELSQIQSSLRDWEERYRSLVSVLSKIVWTTNPVGQIVTEQYAWSEYTGQDYKAYCQYGWIEAIHPEDRDAFLQAWARARHLKVAFTCEGRIWSQKYGDYRYFQAKAVPLFNEYQDIKEWVGTIADIHQHRKMELALKESEERFRVVIQNAPIAVSTTDLELRYTWVHNGEILFGSSHVLGQTDLELLKHQVGGRKLFELKKKALKEKRGLRESISLQKEDGIHTFDVTIEPLFDSQSEIQGVTLAALDVTKMKRAEDAAIAANTAKSQFLANMSHEIRTPIGVILGYCELASEIFKDHPQAASYLQSIQRNGQHLLRIIGEILDLSRIEANKLELESIPVQTVPLILDVVQSFSKQAQEKNLLFNIVTNSLTKKIILTDPTRLRQILTNLIGNSVKFTRRGRITIRLRDSDSGVDFFVEDSGLGMSPEQIEKLFKPFSQGDNSMSRKFGGTGLGLMLSKGLAQKMGGDLVLQWSEAGKGSAFKLSIPAKVVKEPLPVDRNVAPDFSILKDSRILLIEDSKDNQVIVTSYLKNVVGHIDVADDGLQGLEKVSECSYDLILLDIQMPIVDGYETFRRLQKKNAHIPVVALTAHALQSEKEKALKMGFREYITKPLNRGLLIEKLNEILKNPEGNLGFADL